MVGRKVLFHYCGVCGAFDGQCVSDPISAADCWKGQEESSAAIYSSAVTFNELLP